jgi:hypothetical protein
MGRPPVPGEQESRGKAMRRTIISRALALLFILGGTARIIANQNMFAAFGISELWVDDPYFVYIYKVLGAFVILTGLVLWFLGAKPGTGSDSARPVKWGMIVIGFVMLGTGLSQGLAAKFYIVDVAFSWLVAILLHNKRRCPE